MWKLVETADGDLSAEDLLVISVLLADAIRRIERRDGGSAAREREIWQKLQPALRAAHGWSRRPAADPEGTADDPWSTSGGGRGRSTRPDARSTRTPDATDL